MTTWEYPETTILEEAQEAARENARARSVAWAVFYRGHRGNQGDGTWRDLWSAAPLVTPTEPHRQPCMIYTTDGQGHDVFTAL